MTTKFVSVALKEPPEDGGAGEERYAGPKKEYSVEEIAKMMEPTEQKTDHALHKFALIVNSVLNKSAGQTRQDGF